MPIFRKKPIDVHAHQWFKNGDHPDDYKYPSRRALGYEGEIVRYFRRPDVEGTTVCKHCGDIMHNHGWIETLEGGHIVCPGDWILRGVKGEYWPVKPDIFEETYEFVEGSTASTTIYPQGTK